MRKFSFRLEPVLKQRAAAEERAALEQARAQEEYNCRYASYREAREKLARVAQDAAAEDLFDFVNKMSYCSYMHGEVKKREEMVHSARRKLENCRHKLVQAMQERSVLEKLREKQLNFYNLAAKRSEQKETDEIAIQRYVYKQDLI